MEASGFDPLAGLPVAVEGRIGMIQMSEIDLETPIVHQRDLGLQDLF